MFNGNLVRENPLLFLYETVVHNENDMEKILIGLILLSTCLGSGQNRSPEDWTENDMAQYAKLKELAGYVYQKKKTEISKDSLFKNYVYFDNVLNDTDKERRERRAVQFDTLFYYFRKTVDSIGLENLDAKPVRFYKGHKIYEPFDKEKSEHETIGGEKMYARDENVFAYYKKNDPENPLGVLLFEPESDKLAAWIMLNQGGYRYFLTFNLF
ncbi:hypothetical protein KO529_16555 [Arenibacter algicola]|uniref:hypothetical protein n=1 Tax=Arenibacter algicola TaxID=616991 RepID=UPI001C07E659|nr:hypothetical protein [Arenibacter algicola]MBU2906409.1 hypothetical protein [Arenibacter algicola]